LTSPEGPPPRQLSARELIREMVVRFAREHDGYFDIGAGTVTHLRSRDALALAGGLHEMGCSTRVELPVLTHSTVTYELPPGA